jgi:hypothetical protein
VKRYAKSVPMPIDPKAVQRVEAGKPAENKPVLSPPAERALAEAAARRAARERERAGQPAPKEESGRGGLDPTRYGDWEINGLASDF